MKTNIEHGDVLVSLNPGNAHHAVVQGFIDGNSRKVVGVTANVTLQTPLAVVDLGSMIEIPQNKSQSYTLDDYLNQFKK